MTKTKKIYLLIITAISTVVLVYCLGVLFTELVVFAVAIILTLLLSFYAFIRGAITVMTSTKLLTHYRFHLDVLNNKTLVPKETGFVTPSLNQLEQQIENAEKQQQHLQLTMEQMSFSK